MDSYCGDKTVIRSYLQYWQDDIFTLNQRSHNCINDLRSFLHIAFNHTRNWSRPFPYMANKCLNQWDASSRMKRLVSLRSCSVIDRKRTQIEHMITITFYTVTLLSVMIVIQKEIICKLSVYWWLVDARRKDPGHHQQQQNIDLVYPEYLGFGTGIQLSPEAGMLFSLINSYGWACR